MRIGLNCTPLRIPGTLTRLSRTSFVMHNVALIATALVLLYSGMDGELGYVYGEDEQEERSAGHHWY